MNDRLKEIMNKYLKFQSLNDAETGELLTMLNDINTEVKYLLDNWAQDDIPSFAINEFLDTVKSLLGADHE